MLKAHQRFGQFRGQTEPEIAAWLWQILAHNLAGLADDLRTCLASLDFIRCAAVKPTPADATGRDHSGVEPPTGVLGDFRIIREIGRGGMGVVYEAEQISMRRRVALKVLPFAAVLHEKQIRRFKNEALAAGQLQHTSIVPVYSVRCDRGVHFYAMQFIDGQTLGEVIHELRGEGSWQ